jgi:uncharacterized protein YkwD
MTRKYAFRPAEASGLSRLEDRLALSFFGLGQHVVPLIHVMPQHRMVVHHIGAGHGQVAHRNLGTGPTSQSTPSLPIVVVPIVKPPAPSPSTPTAPAPPTTPTSVGIPTVSGVMSAEEQTIVDLVNQSREQNGLAPLQVNSSLVEAAQIQSTDMAELGQFDHELPGAALPTPQSRAQYVGYNWSALGENIAFNYPDANSVMAALLASPDHRTTILNADFTQIGVGIAYDAQGEPYDTQEFGAPA